MTYRPAKNYPLDLYYLMDMTYSMTDDKETLVHTGMNLAETLRNLTENYRMGFGSFVDKPTMPFMPTGKEADNPCALERAVCEKTYGFKHRLSFTDNVTQFVLNVNETKISGNLDNLEGGLDALMQVLVCGPNVRDTSFTFYVCCLRIIRHLILDRLAHSISKDRYLCIRWSDALCRRWSSCRCDSEK